LDCCSNMAKKPAKKKPAKDTHQLTRSVLDAIVPENRTVPDFGSGSL
jgi:hypothetical protein